MPPVLEDAQLQIFRVLTRVLELPPREFWSKYVSCGAKPRVNNLLIPSIAQISDDRSTVIMRPPGFRVKTVIGFVYPREGQR